MKFDEKQGFLNFDTKESSSPKQIEVTKEEINNDKSTKEDYCARCEEIGLCGNCERSKKILITMKKANEGKLVKKGKFYARRHWSRKTE